ncbi:MAG: DUF3108 domain-containing protein [Bryobacteraceae bacterium]
MRIVWAAVAAVALQAETLDYLAEWRFMDAGRVQLTLTEGGASLRLETIGLVLKIYRVSDYYTVQYAPGQCLVSSNMRAEEGAKKRETTVSFRRQTGKAHYHEVDLLTGKVVRDGELDVPACVHDALGALAIVRATGPATATLPVTNGRRAGKVRIERQGKETIRTPAGVFSTVRYEANLFGGVVYERQARTFFWLTDDDKRTPVQIQLRLGMAFGNVTLKLVNHTPGGAA